MKEKKERMKTNDACSETENELYSEQHRVHAETEYPVVVFFFPTKQSVWICLDGKQLANYLISDVYDFFLFFYKCILLFSKDTFNFIF